MKRAAVIAEVESNLKENKNYLIDIEISQEEL
jgi:hypothetical protein